MTDENKKANIEAEWRRAEASLRSARILCDAGEYNDSVSRAYYAAFHAARSLLLTVGLEPAMHHGVTRMIGQHFVEPGTLDKSMGRLLSRMQKFREEADYNRFFVFDEEGATEEVKSAQRLLEATRQILTAGRWL